LSSAGPQATARTTHPILTHDGSNDVVWSKEVPFGDKNDDNLSSGGPAVQKISQYVCASSGIPAKTR